MNANTGNLWINNTCYGLTELTLIGSGSDCHIQIPQANERHARIEHRENGFFIRDLRSSSGFLLNGLPMTEAILTDFDVIELADTRLVFTSQKDSQSRFGMTSKNPLWNYELSAISNVCSTPFPVLLLGPSGTGKEVLAHKIHEASLRRKGAFLSVNCSALTETLVESELFGHIKGSFTGATNDRKGAFEAARGGTLFLDEIGDLPMSLQAKLLRALENNEIRPVGSDRTIHTDVRILAATHQNLLQKVQQGSFRQDLFYRLNVITIHTPALKDRMEDFEDLLYKFAKDLRVRFSFAAIEELKKHTWPGNIRELRNVVARSSALFPQQQIEPHHIRRLLDKQVTSPFSFHIPIDKILPQSNIPQYSQGDKPLSDKISTSVEINRGQATSPINIVREVEKQLIIEQLCQTKGNQRAAARALGIPKSTFHDRMRGYEIDPRMFSQK